METIRWISNDGELIERTDVDILKLAIGLLKYQDSTEGVINGLKEMLLRAIADD